MNVADYARSAQWAASHWKGRIQAWEVWNEPDLSDIFWHGTQDQYVALLKAAYPAFHQGDPGTTVVLAGPSSNDDRWIGEVYAKGGKSSFDVVATHPYQGKPTSRRSIPTTVIAGGSRICRRSATSC